LNRKVSVTEAKNKFPLTIHKVEKGSIVEITRHGRTVAFVVRQKDCERLQENGEALGKFRGILTAEGIVFENLDFSGLRDNTEGRPVDLD
jgi:prevent-host-death family protein